MIFTFLDKLPNELNIDPVLISGPVSSALSMLEYLVVNQPGNRQVFEIRYDFHCSPFKQAILIDNLLAVGHEGYFYLFDLTATVNKLRLSMKGYFGKLYFNDGLFFIADASSVYCLDKNGSIHWKNNSLGIDGVIINAFTNEEILGSGEWDPPGGWQDFALNKSTGIEK